MLTFGNSSERWVDRSLTTNMLQPNAELVRIHSQLLKRRQPVKHVAGHRGQIVESQTPARRAFNRNGADNV